MRVLPANIEAANLFRGVNIGGSGNDDAVLALLRERSPDLLRRLRPDNFAHFAELFTAVVLQVRVPGFGSVVCISSRQILVLGRDFCAFNQFGACLPKMLGSLWSF